MAYEQQQKASQGQACATWHELNYGVLVGSCVRKEHGQQLSTEQKKNQFHSLRTAVMYRFIYLKVWGFFLSV